MHTFQIPLFDKIEKSGNSDCSTLYISVGPGLGFHQFSCFFQPWKPSLQREGMIDGLTKSEPNIVSQYGGQVMVKPLWEKSCIHTTKHPQRARHPLASSILLRLLISCQSLFGLPEKTGKNFASSLPQKNPGF